MSSFQPLGRATRPTERLALAIGVGSMGTLGFAITAPLLPDLADVFGVSRGSIGLVQAAVSIPGVLFSGLIGYLADRFGRRRVVLISLLLFTVFGVAGFFARSYWGLIGVRFAQGIGTSGILGVSIVLVGDIFEGPQLTRAMGINLTGVTTVSMLGPAISGGLASGGTFRPFLVFLIGLPLWLWATRMPPDAPSEPTPSPFSHVRSAVREMRGSGVLSDFGGILAATLAAVIVLHGLGLTTTPLLLDEEFGVSVGVRGLIIAGFQFGVILASVRIGRVIARVKPTVAITIGFGLMAVGTAVVAVAPQVWLVPTGLAVAGVGFGLFVPLAQSYAATAAGPIYRGVTVLTWVTVVRIAQVVGPPGGSMIADNVGTRVGFAAASVAMVVLAVTWRPVRRLLKRL